MTQPEPAAPLLWTRAGFRDDPWRHAATAEALDGNGGVILPLGAFLGLAPQTRRAARERLGVLMLPADPLEPVAPLLGELSLVALAFPAFSDGRSFSKAELLRGRYGFTGAIRATGQVLVDQLPHMLRLGFDQFEVSDPVLLKRLGQGETGGLGLFYQPTAASDAGAADRYSWRRRPG